MVIDVRCISTLMRIAVGFNTIKDIGADSTVFCSSSFFIGSFDFLVGGFEGDFIFNGDFLLGRLLGDVFVTEFSWLEISFSSLNWTFL